MTAKLTTHEPDNERVFEVDENGLSLGRHEDNQASLDDGRLSRFHARINFHDGAWFVQDLDSTNGSFLNGKRIHGEVRLALGDTMRFGATTAELVWEEPQVQPELKLPEITHTVKSPRPRPPVTTPFVMGTRKTVKKPLNLGLRPGLKLPPKMGEGVKPGVPSKGGGGLRPGLKLPPKIKIVKKST